MVRFRNENEDTTDGDSTNLFNFLRNNCSKLIYVVRTLREDQPLRLLLNLLFYHFNRSKPTDKFQRIKLLDLIAACNQLMSVLKIRY